MQNFWLSALEKRAPGAHRQSSHGETKTVKMRYKRIWAENWLYLLYTPQTVGAFGGYKTRADLK